MSEPVRITLDEGFRWGETLVGKRVHIRVGLVLSFCGRYLSEIEPYPESVPQSEVCQRCFASWSRPAVMKAGHRG